MTTDDPDDETLCDVCGQAIPCSESYECACGLMLCALHQTDGRCPECDAARGDFE